MPKPHTIATGAEPGFPRGTALPVQGDSHAQAVGAAPAVSPVAAPVASGSAHAKVILFGEHSVVYGHTAVALPMFNLRMQARAWRTADAARFESAYYTGEFRHAPDFMAAPRAAVEAVLEQVGGQLDGMSVSVGGTIPLGRGLGSSAAAAGAIVDAVARLHGAELSETERFNLVQVAERVAHGRASGLDAYATTVAHPIRFRNGLAAVLPMRLSGRLIVADTGVHGSTWQAVEMVRSLRERFRRRVDRVIEELGTLAEAAVTDLASNQIVPLGGRMNRAQELLEQLKVSHPSIDRLVGVARRAGALGVKLTGAGLGGCVVALAHADSVDTIVQALQEAGAAQTWTLTEAGAAA